MRRRTLVGALGALGLSGCLRLTSDSAAGDGEGSTDGGTTQAGGEPGGSGGDGSDDSGSLFASRPEALDFAARFAASSAAAVGPSDSPEPELIRFGGGWGSSYGSGDDGSVVTSSDLQFESVPESGVPFGGGTGRSLRVRNLTLGAEATFTPDGDATHQVVDWEIDPETEAEPPSEIGLDVGSDGEHVRLRGTWTGDRDLFGRQAFSRYAVELLEDGEVIGTTGDGLFGTGYAWGAKQTREELFVTRQPSTNEDWHVELRVGESAFDPVASQSGDHLVDEGVFRVDLTGLDLESGQYDWSLLVADERPVLENRAIELQPMSTSLIIQ